MGSLVSSSSEDFDQWAFAIDRRRHVPHGKTDLLSDSSVRSDGSALTMLLCSASGISVTYCFVHEILQRGPYAFVLGEGYAGLARRRAVRAHSWPPSSRRAAPPIYPDLIYDRHRRFKSRDDDHAARARPLSATPTSSDGATASAKTLP